MLFTFQWQHEKHFDNISLGPGLTSISTCLSNNIKTKNQQKKKRIILDFCPMNMHLNFVMEIQDKSALKNPITACHCSVHTDIKTQ